MKLMKDATHLKNSTDRHSAISSDAAARLCAGRAGNTMNKVNKVKKLKLESYASKDTSVNASWDKYNWYQPDPPNFDLYK